jgi:hypothetical protein
MSKKQWLLAIVLVAFSVLTAYAVYQVGLIGVFEALAANIASITATVDLTIALTLIAVWMWNDAKARGMSALPYLVLTVAFGSVGPLLYLLRTSRRPEPAAAPARLAVGGVR